MASAVVAPLIGLGSDIFGFLNNKSADSRATTAIANANSAGLGLTNDAVARAMERILATTATNTSAATNAGDWWQAILGAAGDEAKNGIVGATTNANNRIDAATGAATGRVDTGTTNANQLLQGLLQQNTANYAPYAAAGSTAAGNLNSLTGPVTGADRLKSLLDNPASLENTPGYQFQLQQGLQGVQQQAAAHGALQTGGVLKALTQYGQGLAGTTYQNAVQNALSSDRLELDKRGQQFNETLGVANLGMDANKATESGYLGLGAPQASNITSGANLGAQFGVNAGNLGASNLINSGQYAGDVAQRTAAAQTSTGVDLGKWIGDQNIAAAKAAAGIDLEGAKESVPLLQNIGAANAAGILGKASNFNQLLSGGGNSLLDLFNTNAFKNLFKSGGGGGGSIDDLLGIGG